MIECTTTELQDLLPDFVTGALDDITMSRVTSHVSRCQACTEELMVLRAVRAARPRVPMPDVQQIVAALPTRQRPGRGAMFGRSAWRMAAALGIIIAGGASLQLARRGLVSVPPVPERPGTTDGAPLVANTPTFDTAETVAVRAPIGVSGVSMSYGDLTDLSEDELQRMLERLDKWDGATSTEPLPGVPLSVTAGGGIL
ncbi:anti-sigma factor family protein [Gemmatimonas sp.]|jgi:hypothetical protein|uniref:anti-sigma factor family protein n=1 Tax=Gemmatimonas sp. TaxID=1962908 RepID=UPI0037C05A4C